MLTNLRYRNIAKNQKKIGNEIEDASKMLFFSFKGDKFKSSMRFKIDLSLISKSDHNKLSNIFEKHDQEYCETFKEDDECMYISNSSIYQNLSIPKPKNLKPQNSMF